MPYWTNKEHERLWQMHKDGVRRTDVMQAFPRHTPCAVDVQISLLKIKFGTRQQGRIARLVQCHQYFIAQERWYKAYRY